LPRWSPPFLPLQLRQPHPPPLDGGASVDARQHRALNRRRHGAADDRVQPAFGDMQRLASGVGTRQTERETACPGFPPVAPGTCPSRGGVRRPVSGTVASDGACHLLRRLPRRSLGEGGLVRLQASTIQSPGRASRPGHTRPPSPFAVTSSPLYCATTSLPHPVTQSPRHLVTTLRYPVPHSHGRFAALKVYIEPTRWGSKTAPNGTRF